MVIRGIERSLTYVVLTIFFVLGVAPVVWMVMTSFKPNSEIISSPWGIPSEIYIQNYIRAIEVGKFGLYLKNSLIVTTFTILLVLAISLPAAYALARMRFHFANWIFYLVLGGLIIQKELVLIPLYIILRSLNLVSTYAGLILPYAAFGIPFSVFLLRGYFRTLPSELADAAKIDGCSDWGVFWQIMLPLSGPPVAALGIFQSLWNWNEFLFAWVFVREEAVRTLPVGLVTFRDEVSLVNYGALFAALTMMTIPMMVIYLVFQRQFVQGLTAGSLKS